MGCSVFKSAQCKRSIRGRVRSSITWRELVVAPLHQEESAELARAVGSDASWRVKVRLNG